MKAAVINTTKLVKTLQWTYSLVILGLPIFSVFFVHYNASALAIISEPELHFLQRSYFLVVLFTLFMLLLLHEYLPDTLPAMLNLILSPFLIIALQWIIEPISAIEYIAQAGMLHITTIILAFTFLVSAIFIMILVSMVIEKKWDWSAIGGGVLMCGLQLLFIIPGLGAAYIFGKYIIMHNLVNTSANGNLWHWSTVIIAGSYLLSLVQATWVFGKRLKTESVIG